MEVPLENAGAKAVGGILSPTDERKVAGLSGGRVRQTSLPAEFVEELSQLTQALEVEEVRSSDRRRRRQRVADVVRRVQRHGGMAAIGQTDDDIRAAAVADTDHGQLLSAERMMRMRDGHESRRGLGRGGSALGLCLRSSTVASRHGSRMLLNRNGRRSSRAVATDSDRGAAAMMPSPKSTSWPALTGGKSGWSMRTSRGPSIAHVDTLPKNATAGACQPAVA